MAHSAVERSTAWYSTQAYRNRIGYWTSETLLVVLGAAVPVSTAVTDNRAVPAVLGGGVVVVTGLRRIFNWQENWARFTGAHALLTTEQTRFLHHRPPYDSADAGENEAVLALKVREIEEAETQGWLVLRKPTTDR